MGNDRNTVILSTDNGMIALDSPVKLKILEILEGGFASFDEIVEKSNKAKSTISVHLHDLEKMKLIKEKAYPNDRRKKYFVLNAIYLAFSQPPLRKQYNKQMDVICSCIANGDSFKEKLFGNFCFGMEAYGIDPSPILKKLGIEIGARIGRELESHNFEGILDELSIFWAEHDLGKMSLIDDPDIGISVIDCHHCGKMPNVGKTLCSMDEGIVEGILKNKLNMDCYVQEIECYGTGHNNCKFIVNCMD